MDQLKSFGMLIRERLSSPFIFSFMIAWLLLNWEIPIAILFMNQNELLGGNYLSFISDQLQNEKKSLYQPLKYALGYTIIYPFLKILINGISDISSVLYNKLSLLITGKDSIPGKKYLEMVKKYENSEQAFIEFENNERKMLNDRIVRYEQEKQDLLKEIANANDQVIESNKKINDLSITNDLSLLQGRWLNEHKYPDGKVGKEEVYIDGNLYYQVNNNQRNLVARIHHYSYNSINRSIFFVKVLEQEYINLLRSKNIRVNRCLINELKFMSLNELEGSEDYDMQIKYKKINNIEIPEYYLGKAQ